MKKITAIICALTLAAFSLCACGNNEEKKDESSAAASQTEQSSAAASQTEQSSAAASQTEQSSNNETPQNDSVVGTWKVDADKIRELMTAQMPSLPAGATVNMNADGTLDMKADNTFVLTFNVSVQASVADVSQAAMDQNMQMQGEGTYTQNGSNLALTLTHGTLTVNGQTSETTQSSTTNATFNGNEIVFENNGVQMVFTR